MRTSWSVLVTACIISIASGVGTSGKKASSIALHVEPSGIVRLQTRVHPAANIAGSDTVRISAASVKSDNAMKGTPDANDYPPPECNSAVGGFYTDPNHHREGTLAGTRMISKANKDGQIVLIGSDDGTEFWKLTGKSSGSCGSFAIDFSPKGGPADAVSTYKDGFLTFGDGNAWEKKTQRESFKATGAASDVGGLYTDPNHFDAGSNSWAGTRFVSQKEGNKLSDVISIVGSDDGNIFYDLRGAALEGELSVDFSPKKGPADLHATFSSKDGMLQWIWPDGNVWSRTKAE